MFIFYSSSDIHTLICTVFKTKYRLHRSINTLDLTLLRASYNHTQHAYMNSYRVNLFVYIFVVDQFNQYTWQGYLVRTCMCVSSYVCLTCVQCRYDADDDELSCSCWFCCGNDSIRKQFVLKSYCCCVKGAHKNDLHLKCFVIDYLHTLYMRRMYYYGILALPYRNSHIDSRHTDASHRTSHKFISILVFIFVCYFLGGL